MREIEMQNAERNLDSAVEKKAAVLEARNAEFILYAQYHQPVCD